MGEIWHKLAGATDNKKFKQKSINERLQAIEGKLFSLSGYLTAMRYETADNFKESKRLNQRYLYSIENKAELYFYITIALFFVSFCQRDPEIFLLFISLFSDQNTLEFIKSLLRG